MSPESEVPAAPLNWWKATEKETVGTVPALGLSEQFLSGRRGKGLCVHHGMFLPEFWHL